MAVYNIIVIGTLFNHNELGWPNSIHTFPILCPGCRKGIKLSTKTLHSSGAWV